MDEKTFDLLLDNMKDMKQDLKNDIKNLVEANKTSKLEEKEEMKSFKKEMKLDLQRLEDKIDEINSKVMTKEECERKRNECINVLDAEVKKNEWTVKKISAVGGIVVGSITALTGLVTAIVAAILKLLN